MPSPANDHVSKHLGSENTKKAFSFDLIIVGAGLVGASFANLIARFMPHWQIALVESASFKTPVSSDYDARSIVLTYGSQQIFESLGLWKFLTPYAKAIEQVQTTEKGRFGSVRLRAHHYQVPALGYVVESYRLLAELHGALKEQTNVQWFCPAQWQSLKYENECNHLQLICGQNMQLLQAPLLVAVDGAHSNIRAHYDIVADTFDFKQMALVANIELLKTGLSGAHERLTHQGPITLLPLYDGRYALIWILNQANSAIVKAYDDATFMAHLQAQLSPACEVITKIGKRSTYPLTEVVARQQHFPGGVLLGNSAHSLHPIGAQGFNLGLRDALVLSQTVKERWVSAKSWSELHQSYVLARQKDQKHTIQTTRWLSHLFTIDRLPHRLGRRLVFHAMHLPLFKRRVAKQAMGLGLNMPLPLVQSKDQSQLTKSFKICTTPQTDYDVVIVGGGIVGATLARCLINTPLKVALLDYQKPSPLDLKEYDPRVSALTLSSQQLFHNLGVWPQIIAGRVAPYQRMVVWDDRNRKEIKFNAAKIDHSLLGWIVENKIIRHALWQSLSTQDNIDCLSPVSCEKFSRDDQYSVLTTTAGTLKARLIVGADGALSWVRQHADFKWQEKSYQQHALVATVALTNPHQFTAWQCFTADGPIALLPLDDPYRATVIWSQDGGSPDERLTQETSALAAAMAVRLGQRFGEMTLLSKPVSFPLVMRHAKQYSKAGVVLCGDAAHTIHPLAGQGVNLGLLDAAALAELIITAHQAGTSLADERVLRRYERWRRGDSSTMIAAMEAFKQLFGHSNSLITSLRGLGLSWVNHSQLLKQFFMQHAVGQRRKLPNLMMNCSSLED